jgi:hypothetical protein
MLSEKNFGSSVIFLHFVIDRWITNFDCSKYSKKVKILWKPIASIKNSKLILQLNNGKIITLIHIDQENCGTMIRDDKDLIIELLRIFMFMKESFEDLKTPLFLWCV